MRTVCELYLIVPPVYGPVVVSRFEEVVGMGEIACVLLQQTGQKTPDLESEKSVVRLAQERNIAVLTENDLEKAALLDTDGVHLSRYGDGEDAAVKAYHDARAAVGAQKNVGVYAGTSRHTAMIVAEAGADYVAFGDGAPPDFASDGTRCLHYVEWWSSLFQPPCVAWNINSVSGVRQNAKGGADFVAVGSLIWDHGSGVADGLDLVVNALTVE